MPATRAVCTTEIKKKFWLERECQSVISGGFPESDEFRFSGCHAVLLREDVDELAHPRPHARMLLRSRLTKILHPLFRGNYLRTIAATHCDDLVDHSRGVIDRPKYSESCGGTGECGGSLPEPGPLPEVEAINPCYGLHRCDCLLPRIGRWGSSDAENSNVIRDRLLQRPLAWDCFESVCTCCVSFRVAGKVYVHVTSGRTLFEVIHNAIKWFESDHWLGARPRPDTVFEIGAVSGGKWRVRYGELKR
jgi:hypothetical protein